MTKLNPPTDFSYSPDDLFTDLFRVLGSVSIANSYCRKEFNLNDSKLRLSLLLLSTLNYLEAQTLFFYIFNEQRYDIPDLINHCSYVQ
jgi:hypothetical protein